MQYFATDFYLLDGYIDLCSGFSLSPIIDQRKYFN